MSSPAPVYPVMPSMPVLVTRIVWPPTESLKSLIDKISSAPASSPKGETMTCPRMNSVLFPAGGPEECADVPQVERIPPAPPSRVAVTAAGNDFLWQDIGRSVGTSVPWERCRAKAVIAVQHDRGQYPVWSIPVRVIVSAPGPPRTTAATNPVNCVVSNPPSPHTAVTPSAATAGTARGPGALMSCRWSGMSSPEWKKHQAESCPRRRRSGS